MYLKSLDIKGFKSFADNTEVNFEPGINIIVGPNGCGKSNIVDAIKWVLGEANVRHLRGQKNEDVIFNGSDKKKALGMAAVDMIIDNSDKSLPVDYREVSISRKIFRSGESEYYINKSRVRLKDIVRLFTGTGLGKRGYSIISQGELEQVLNGQPFDRRLMLEEASGIIKYRQQRDEVTSRISTTANDLLRLGDILNELKIRKEELSGKAAKAKHYADLHQEFDALERQLLAGELLSIQDKFQKRQEEKKDKQEKMAHFLSQLEQLETALKESENLLEEKRSQLAKVKEEKYQTESQLNSLQSEIKLSQERINNCRERFDSAGHDSEKYALMLGKLEGDLKNSIDGFAGEKEKFSVKKQQIEDLEAEVKSLEQEIIHHNESFEIQREMIFECAEEEAKINNQIIDHEEQIKKAREKKERLLIHVDENLTKLKEWEQQVSRLEKQSSETINYLQDENRHFNKINDEKASLKSKCLELDQEHNKINQEIIKLENRIIALEDLDKNYVGYSEGVKAILKAHAAGERSLRGIQGLMAKIIDVPQGMETAIDIAAGKGLENIVVGTANEARLAIDFLKKQHLGRITFLPLDSLRVKKVPDKVVQSMSNIEGVLGIASRLVGYEGKYEKAVEYLLGHVLLVNTMDNGMKVFKNLRYPLRIVSLEGELINVSGAMTGGSQKRHRVTPLQRRAEEKEIHNQLDNLYRGRTELQKDLKKIRAQIEQVEAVIAEIRNNLAELQFQSKMLEEEHKKMQNSILGCSRDNDAFLKEIAQLDKTINDLDKVIMNLHSNYNSLHEKNISFSDEIEELREEMETERREFEVRRERLSLQSDQLIMKEKELRNIEQSIKQFEQVKASYKQSLSESIGLKEELEKEMKLHRASIESCSAKKEVKRREIEVQGQKLGAYQNAEKEYRLNIENLRKEILPCRQQLSSSEDEIRSVEMILVRTETELNALYNRWEEKFSQDKPSDYIAEMNSAEIRRDKRKLGSLREDLEQMGPVDSGSINEYTEVKERFDFLEKQYQDLIEAKASLEELLKETEKIMDSDFKQFINLANDSFTRTFKDIFGGGDASLSIDKGEDFLASGVDILVKMPGKKIQSLNLLSGGERALTCIAFIFALFRLKPAPFCLLDEIDAALDETNLLRFSNFLRTMAVDMQFIIITHRQATIESGYRIYGVTMPQQGVSSVLSIQNDEAQEIAG